MASGRYCNFLATGYRTAVFAAVLLVPCFTFAQSTLEQCAEQFIGGNVANAPTLFSSPPEKPFGSNQHLCYRANGVSFFALEYWPEQFAPRWAAYKLSPDNYGANGCSTYTRATANCYVNETTWQEFLACKKRSDPFHADHMLAGEKLGPGDFENTGHDRGHIAPRQAFSWHVCGTYQTFSMANMSPQRAFLNQDIWQYLEQQVLTWAFDSGPLYVVTGTTFRTFPHERFQVYQDGILDPQHIYASGSVMQEVVERHHANFDSTSAGDILRPKRNANPSKVPKRARNLRMPTGYFKVIYRPAIAGEPAHAIGFLLPHTFENLNMLAERIAGMDEKQTFWSFVSRIDLIEEVSGVRFPAIPQSMKSGLGDSWFSKNAREIRSKTCGLGNPQGVLPNSTREERLAACISELH